MFLALKIETEGSFDKSINFRLHGDIYQQVLKGKKKAKLSLFLTN
jgi:hypothetical protein